MSRGFSWRRSRFSLSSGWTEFAVVDPKKYDLNTMPAWCFGKSPMQSFRKRFHKRAPDKTNKTPPDDSSPSADLSAVTELASEGPEDLWMRAEWQLKQNETTNKILRASADILKEQFQLDIQTDGITGQRLCGFLEIKNRELEGKKLIAEERLAQVFRNVLVVKDVVNAAASASPPAAIACAGVTVGLLVRMSIAPVNAAIQC